MAPSELLFVYGTLRPPATDAHRVHCFNFPKVVPFLIGARPARVAGAALFDLGSFPAAIPGEGVVHGALLEVRPEAFVVLDPLEGHPDLYVRARVQAQTDGGILEAWIYWAPEDLAHSGTPVPEGDWLRSKMPG